MSSERHISSLVPRNTYLLNGLLVLTSMITAATLGYDSSMMNGLNILTVYTDYFKLTTATNSTNTAAIYIGHVIAAFVVGSITDRWGRINTLFWSAASAIVGVALQTGAVNIAMFIVGRIIIGFGTGMAACAGPTYLSEATGYRFRAIALGMFFDFFFVGGLIASGVVFGAQKMQNTWAWRLPSLIQVVFAVVSIVILPFLPESPRWLIKNGHLKAALEALACTHSNGDENDPIVLAQYRQIIDTMRHEEETHQKANLWETVRTRTNRYRLALALSCAVFAQLCGNNVITYYLGAMLTAAGITDATTQLQINIILNAWGLVIAVIGTFLADRLGRRKLSMSVQVLIIIFIFLIGGLTKVYGNGGSTSGIYATVAMIFLFQGAYAFGWTPLSVMYPPEVLSYPIRANGMGMYMAFLSFSIILVVFAFPIGLEKIGWKIYLINGAIDILFLIWTYFYWVETRGKTLEEIDELFDGQKHTSMPNLADLRNGKAGADEILIGIEPIGVEPIEAVPEKGMKMADTDIKI